MRPKQVGQSPTRTPSSSSDEIVAQTAEGVSKDIVPKQELSTPKPPWPGTRPTSRTTRECSKSPPPRRQESQVHLGQAHPEAAVDGEVQQVLKHAGEGVKAQEPVLVIHDFGQLRAIGNLPKEYVNIVGRATR